MKVLRWLADYWWIPALILVGVGLSLFGRRMVEAVFGSSFQEKLELELGAIDAKRETREVRLQQGHDAAVRHVREKYKAEFEALDAKEAARVKELEANPEKLAKAMAKAARR